MQSAAESSAALCARQRSGIARGTAKAQPSAVQSRLWPPLLRFTPSCSVQLLS
jgi:hypothetical protein